MAHDRGCRHAVAVLGLAFLAGAQAASAENAIPPTRGHMVGYEAAGAYTHVSGSACCTAQADRRPADGAAGCELRCRLQELCDAFVFSPRTRLCFLVRFRHRVQGGEAPEASVVQAEDRIFGLVDRWPGLRIIAEAGAGLAQPKVQQSIAQPQKEEPVAEEAKVEPEEEEAKEEEETKAREAIEQSIPEKEEAMAEEAMEEEEPQKQEAKAEEAKEEEEEEAKAEEATEEEEPEIAEAVAEETKEEVEAKAEEAKEQDDPAIEEAVAKEAQEEAQPEKTEAQAEQGKEVQQPKKAAAAWPTSPTPGRHEAETPKGRQALVAALFLAVAAKLLALLRSSCSAATSQPGVEDGAKGQAASMGLSSLAWLLPGVVSWLLGDAGTLMAALVLTAFAASLVLLWHAAAASPRPRLQETAEEAEDKGAGKAKDIAESEWPPAKGARVSATPASGRRPGRAGA